MPRVIGTNALLRSMKDCKNKNDLEYLSSLYQDENVSNNVRKRARYKIAKIWAKCEKSRLAGQKAAETRKKNKDEKLARMALTGVKE